MSLVLSSGNIICICPTNILSAWIVDISAGHQPADGQDDDPNKSHASFPVDQPKTVSGYWSSLFCLSMAKEAWCTLTWTAILQISISLIRFKNRHLAKSSLARGANSSPVRFRQKCTRKFGSRYLC